MTLGMISADLVVEIGGKVFWDLNEDDVPSLSEGVPEVNVTIMGSNNTAINQTIVTDENGVWSLFRATLEIFIQCQLTRKDSQMYHTMSKIQADSQYTIQLLLMILR